MPLFGEIVAYVGMVPAALDALVDPCRRLRNRRAGTKPPCSEPSGEPFKADDRAPYHRGPG
jgi:hypothetical protein